ncbi:hypothetical protein CRX72_08385 [Pantoea sp. BRM17]|nr:hypothetical protein CRX72_08385 [Pantoea sp. BRM17]
MIPHILRVLYYRPLQNLLPASPLRRSETHLARQIFSGLTRINEENGEIEPDIAHHWQQLSAQQWRFYLLTWQAEAGRGKRSQLRFRCTGLALQQQRAEALLEQDGIDQLVQLVGDKAQVRQMIAAHLGRSVRQGNNKY